jgi:hypothetical protein
MVLQTSGLNCFSLAMKGLRVRLGTAVVHHRRLCAVLDLPESAVSADIHVHLVGWLKGRPDTSESSLYLVCGDEGHVHTRACHSKRRSCCHARKLVASLYLIAWIVLYCCGAQDMLNIWRVLTGGGFIVG